MTTPNEDSSSSLPAVDKRDIARSPAPAMAQPTTDTLVACLGFIAQHHGLPFSAAVALSGLPIENDLLTTKLLPRAAERVGLKCRMVRRAVDQIPELVLPAIVMQQDGSFAVMTLNDREKGYAKLQLSGENDAEVELTHEELRELCTSLVIYLVPVSSQRSEGKKRSNDLKGHWFWSVARKLWPSWSQVILIALCINLLALATPLFVMNVYDRVIPNNAISTLMALTVGVLIAIVFDLILKQVRSLILDQAGQKADMYIASRLFEHALSLHFKNRPKSAGVLASKIQNFEMVRDFFTSSTIVSVIDFCFIGIFLYVMWLIVGPLAYVPLLAVPIVLAITLLCHYPLASSVDETIASSGVRHSLLMESLVGMEALRAANAEGQMQRRWEQAVAINSKASSKMRSWSNFSTNASAFVQQGVSVCVVIWGVFLVGDGVVSLGGLIAANILSGRVLQPLAGIAQTISRSRHAFGAMAAITQFMTLDVERDEEISGKQTVQSTEIVFENVSFTYPEAVVPALTDVSLTIKPGERIAIIGPVGSGKTTIGRLLAGFYDIDDGLVMVDSIDIRQHDKAMLRHLVGYVGQDAELFNGTVRDNIILGRQTAPQEHIQVAADITGVSSFSARHPQGLDMEVGERGRNLSGGQRQAVALARILLRQPAILFLDEPTASMDVGREAQFVRQMSSVSRTGMTLIISTHRPSLISLVDRIIQIEDGKIVKDGPKQEILDTMNGAKTTPAEKSAKIPFGMPKKGNEDE